jgi:hypothetical protein
MEGQLLVAQEAQRRCRPLYPHLGRYRFEGTEKVGQSPSRPEWKVSQQVTCGSRPAAEPAAAAPVDSNWQPTPELARQIRESTLAYFDLVDAGDPARSHALWSASNREMRPLDEWRAELQSARARAGKPLGHRVAKLTWYVNPEHAPEPGIYVAADYEKKYEKLAANCGYLIWFRAPSGQFVIVREESGVLEKAQAAGLSRETMAEVRKQLRCEPSEG